MSEWNSKTLSDSFESAANNAEIYLNEIRSKAKNDISYQFLYDQTLAEFWLYNGLWGKIFLEDRKSFIKELYLRLETSPGFENQGYDKKRLQNFYNSMINNLLKEYEEK